MSPSRSYVIAATPRTGSHLLSGALASTGVAGQPREWLPRFTAENAPRTALDRMRLVTQPPKEAPHDPEADAAHIRKFIASGTSENGVFGVVLHWVVVQDAARRLQAFLGTEESAPHRVLASAFPNLSYVWLRRRDKVAQAVSWYKAIQTGVFVGGRGKGRAGEREPLQFDYVKIRHLLSATTNSENAWSSFFSSNGLKPLVLYYEDLSAQYVSTLRSVLDFLQVDAAGVDVASPKHEKQADAQSLEWIEEFKRLHAQARSPR
jgi:LPS sulfotransferase NodH